MLALFFSAEIRIKEQKKQEYQQKCFKAKDEMFHSILHIQFNFNMHMTNTNVKNKKTKC